MENIVNKTDKIKQTIREAKDIVIMPSKVAGIDSFAAGVGLYRALKKQGKNVTLVYPGLAPEEFGSVEGLEIISNTGKRDLLVSVDYSGTEASKVNYSTTDDVLHFSIGPVDKDFDLSRVKAEVRGLNFDLIITIGVQYPEDLGRSFADITGEFRKVEVINIDNTEKNQRFGDINIVNPSVESLSLLTLNTLASCELNIDSEAAEALLKGVSKRKGI